jgi:ATP-dependent Clp protease protease subunit
MLHSRMFKAAKGKPEYRIENKGEEATIYLYDEIGFWGVELQPFVKDLNELTAKTIHLRINSPGGSVFDGTTMYNALKEHPARIVAHIDGLAASIATVIAMAADEVIAAENSFMMIHEPWSAMAGGADEMRKQADLLDKVGTMIAQVYTDRTGADEKVISGWMTDETWFTAEEAEAAGLVDKIDKNVGKEKNQTGVLFDLSVFKCVPEALKNGPHPSKRDLEKTLRDAGCTQTQAKSILADGFPEEDHRDGVLPAADGDDLHRDGVDDDPPTNGEPPVEPNLDQRDVDPDPVVDEVADVLLRVKRERLGLPANAS